MTTTSMGEALVLAVLAALVAGMVGLLAVLWLVRRSVRWAAVVAPVAVVLPVVVGVLVSVQTMILSAEQSRLVLAVLTAAVPMALLLGVLIAGRVQTLDRAAAEQEADRLRAEQVEASRREMVAWVSHDLRTPLAGLRATVEALEDGIVDRPEASYQQMLGQVGVMSEMVDDLLALSRMQSGTLTMRSQVVSLADVVSDALATTAPLAEAEQVRLRGGADGPVPAEVDVSLVSRAMTNLVVNAVHHTPRGGAVTVHAGSDTGWAVLRVDDECGGIPDEQLARVFEPGWRGTSARTSGAGEHAGLGLAVVAGAARLHGGTVGVSNLEHGCRFDLRLPLTTG